MTLSRPDWIALAAALALMPLTAQAGETVLVIKDHIFSPATVTVAAGETVTLVVRNQDSSAEEFESHDLKIEKIVKGGKEIKLTIGPLAPGEYKFVGEHHEDTAKGVIIAK